MTSICSYFYDKLFKTFISLIFEIGSTSYVVGLPGLSHVIAVWCRAGWQLGGVLPCYISSEEGGDQMVGRVVCGLPSGNLNYTMLPARFKSSSVVDWAEIVPNYVAYPPGQCSFNLFYFFILFRICYSRLEYLIR